MQGLVLGSVYYGYATSQILGGRLAEVFGGKMVFGIAVLSTAVLSLVTPVAARCDVSLVLIIRILEGIGQGMTLPAMHSMLARWAPDSEKSVLVNIVHNGIDIGTVISMSATGLLCGSDFLGGWPSTFYVFGMIGCLWYIAWHFLVTDSPASHPCITESELNYIVKDQNMKPNEQLSSVPWIKILKSVPFWALVATQFAQDWNFYILLNDLPTFMSNILHFRIEEDGVLSALPHLSELIIRSIVSVLSDSVIRRGWVSVGTSRKFCNTLGCLSSAIGLTVICFIGCDVKSTVAVFVLSNGIAGFSGSGYVLNHLDLSPEYAGTLMGLAGTIANLTGFIAPAVVGAFTENAQTRHQWSLVFAITITLLLVSTAIFAIFGSAEKQEWTKDEEPNTKS